MVRRPNEGGFTLMEVMVAMAVSTIIIIPLSGWFVSVLRQQGELFDNNQDVFSQGLVSQHFPADVASAAQVWTPGAAPFNSSAVEATNADCAGTDPASGGGGTIVATFVTSGDQSVALPGPAIRTTYTERAGSGGSLTLFRRECPNGSTNVAATSASILVSNLGGPTTVTCATRVSCPQVTITVRGRFRNQIVTTSATRRTDTVVPLAASNLPPSAVIKATPSGGYRPLLVHFNGDLSSDPIDSITNFYWDFGDGSPPVSGLITGIDHTYTFASGGAATFTAVLTVTNSGGATNTASVVINVNRNPPVASILSVTPLSPGRNQAVNFVSKVTTDDGNTAGMTYLWNFGPNAVVPAGQTLAANPTGISWTQITASQPITLKVTDPYGSISNAGYSVTVNNAPPTAVISAPLPAASLTRGIPVAFKSVGSNDIDGTIATYAWNFGDGQTATGPSPSHTYATLGSFTVSLTVTDDGSASGFASIPVTVAAAPPTVTLVLTAPATTVYRGLAATFTATGTKIGGTIVSYKWDFGGFIPTVTAASNVSPPVTYPDRTPRVVTVTATDSDGLTVSSTMNFTPANLPPTVVLTRTPPTGAPPFVMQFSSAGSADPDGGPLSFLWTYKYPNGTVFATSTLPIDSRTITPGSYQVTLTATDIEGGVTSTTNSFTVAGKLPAPTLTASGLTFSWSPVWGAENYEIFINYAACGQYSGTITVAAPGTTGTLSGQCPYGTTYVNVRAVGFGAGLTPSDYALVLIPR